MREVIGHESAWERLTRAADTRTIRHAYLLSGVEGIGKASLALEFARYLECEQPDPTEHAPCGTCNSCRKILHRNHPDVTLVETQEGKRQLGVDAVRDAVVRTANLAPSSGAWRIFILPQVERMTPNTTNALLKTIEEPPPGVVLLLTTSNPDDLLPTLLSRCQIVPMYPVPVEQIEALLRERLHVPPAEAQALARSSEGRPGWAVRAMEHPELLQDREEQMKLIQRAVSAARDERIRIAGQLAKDGDTAARALDYWALYWRRVVLAAHGAEMLPARDDPARRLGRAIGPTRALRFMQALLQARTALEQNANARLTMEVLMLDLPQPGAAATRG